MEKNTELWVSVKNKCLQRAIDLLDNKTAPAAATAETVRGLVETAILIDMTDLHWAQQIRKSYNKGIEAATKISRWRFW